MIERRRFMRVDEDDEIAYSIIPNYKSERKLTQNLSLGGVRFISDHFVPLSSILKIKIKLKYTQRAINAIARVVWIKSIFNDERYEIGAEFIETKSEDLEFLNYYLSKRR